MDVIVVGTDGSPGAQAAVQKVIELMGDKGATVNLVCAYPGRSALERIGMTARTESVDLRGVAADVLARDERRLEEAGFNVETHARQGDPADTLIDVADDVKAEMIVVGARGNTESRRFHMGSVAVKLAHHARTSLLVVH
jgi:nucleotide-binding universal stress UspA family protein